MQTAATCPSCLVTYDAPLEYAVCRTCLGDYKKEFRGALLKLNLATDAKSIDAAFDSLDDDRSGAISYHE